MHEMSIAQSVLEIVDETLSREKFNKLKEVVVQVGQLVAVVPDSLIFCFEALIEDTVYQGAKITVEIIPTRAVCNACRHEFEIREICFSCPRCESTEIRVTRGEELTISHLEVD